MTNEVNYSEKYDIFLSYRRDGGETMAVLLHDRLVAKGYSVFLDIESLNSGSFNKKLLSVIEGCTDVVVVCSKGSLDRCINEGDWVRMEIVHALKNGKNVVPIFLRDFHWPDALPEDMEALRVQNGVNANSTEYFDAAVDRLADKFLQSTPQASATKKPKIQKQPKVKEPLSKTTKGILVIAFSLVVVVGLVFGSMVLWREKGRTESPKNGQMTNRTVKPLPPGVYRPVILAGDVVTFTPKGTATIYLKDGTQQITYPGSLPQVDTKGEAYGAKFPGESTRDFYFEEAKVVYIAQVAENMYKITGQLVSGEEILKYTSDKGYSVPISFRVFTDKGKIVSIPYTYIDRIEVDNTVTPMFNIGRTATIKLRNGTVYKVPEAAVEFSDIKTVGYAPQYDYKNGLSIRTADGIETVLFSAMKKVAFTPELIDFKTLKKDTYPCPGTITYTDGTEVKVDFAIGGYYSQTLDLFCPYWYSFDLRNNKSSQYGGPYMNESTISEVLSIEFDK